MAAVTVAVPALPAEGAVVELHGVAWPEESFEVLAFLNVPAGTDAARLADDDPHFVGRFFLYGSGRPRPAHADGIGLDIRVRIAADAVARFGAARNVLALVARDAAGRPLAPADLRVGTASLAR